MILKVRFVSRVALFEYLTRSNIGFLVCRSVPIPELQLDIPFDTLRDANVKIFFQQLR
jgi:hypothetical protein